MVRCLPRFLAIQRWRRSRKFACLHKAGRHEFSAEWLDPFVRRVYWLTPLARKPPSTTRVCPVTKEAASEQR